MYAVNFYSEVTNLKKQHLENKFEVFYFSKAVTSFEMFGEFFFEIMNEKVEPFIFLFEFLKAAFRFKEY
jgi:hypothetical protein